MSKTLVSTLVDTERPSHARQRWTARVVALAGRVVETDPIVLEGSLATIGRDPAAHVPLEDPRVSRRHASVHLRGEEAELALHGRTVSRLDGVPVERAPLRDGSALVIGASALVFRRAPPLGAPPPSFGLLGDSPATRAVRRTIQLVGPTGASVLVEGESGTGKELVARALHEASGRRGPIVAINTSAIPATLAEAHLFGHVAGAFTGATSAAPGVFRAAEGGTLFLDEIGDLPADLQPKLLRVLEDRVVTPVGSTKGVSVDVRIIAATNQDLLAAVDAGRFRGDLYARLSDFTLHLTPLRERREDVLVLLARDLGDAPPPLAADLIAELLAREWRFNVRELRKVGTQLRVRGEGATTLTLAMVDPAPRASRPRASSPPSGATERTRSVDKASVPTRSELEAMLVRHAGVIENIAQETGRSRRQVHRWLEKFGLDVESYRQK